MLAAADATAEEVETFGQGVALGADLDLRCREPEVDDASEARETRPWRTMLAVLLAAGRALQAAHCA